MRVILSGMASSSIGLLELPYATTPLQLDGSNLITRRLPATQDHRHETILISGLKTQGDVMRGEETQAVGWFDLIDSQPERCILILPGTHSKHLFIENKKITNFKTYMTGELFDLLSRHSILKDSVTEGYHRWDIPTRDAFVEGVLSAKSNPLSHAIFTIRAKVLESSLPKAFATHFLSGLLIGHELKDLSEHNDQVIVMGCTDQVAHLYHQAMYVFGLDRCCEFISAYTVDRLVTAGHRIIYFFTKK